MKSTAIFVLMWVITSFTSDESADLVHRLIVQPESVVTIDGKTNLNKFTCQIAHYRGRDTLVLHEGGKNVRPVFVKGSVSLDASNFDCGIGLMTSDFRKTIQSDEHPSIVIDFISFERTPSYRRTEETFKGIVKISLGGTTRLFEMDCIIEAKSTGLIHLRGTRDFTFRDFNLQPPIRMMGMVKVDQMLSVSFHLVLRLDDEI